MDALSNRNEAYPGAGFTQDELDENAKWAKAHDEFDGSVWEPRPSPIVLESIAIKLDTLNRTMKSIGRMVEFIVFSAVGVFVAWLISR